MRRVGASLKLERQYFGPVLRAGRERRRVSLEQLCRDTNVREELWTALESNDFSRWPNGIYARSLIRQYAAHVDLHPDHLVDEFCRLFPNGDRRRDRVVREYAAIIAHPFEALEEVGPADVRRRLDDPQAEPARVAELLQPGVRMLVELAKGSAADAVGWVRRRLRGRLTPLPDAIPHPWRS